MAKCGDCLHFPKCSHYVTPEETFPEVGGCSAFKNKGDFVEVVRCKDCKYGNNHCDNQGFCTYCQIGIQDYPVRKQQDDFCSYGERREGE